MNKINKNQTLVIIPTYNEELSVLTRVVNEVLKRGFCVLVVNDGSDIPYIFHKNDRFKVINHEVNLGQGEALNTGVKYALKNGFDYCITFDGDGQHDPNELDLFLQNMIEEPVDILLGSRFLIQNSTNVSYSKKIILKGGILLNYMLSGLYLTDSNCGYRMFNKRAMNSMNFKAKRMGHASELMWLIKYNKLIYREIPVNVLYTDYSVKKGQNIKRVIPVTAEVLREYFKFKINKLLK